MGVKIWNNVTRIFSSQFTLLYTLVVYSISRIFQIHWQIRSILFLSVLNSLETFELYSNQTPTSSICLEPWKNEEVPLLLFLQVSSTFELQSLIKISDYVI